jgi:hypothetical protein
MGKMGFKPWLSPFPLTIAVQSEMPAFYALAKLMIPN